jgi:hypothetical protein
VDWNLISQCHIQCPVRRWTSIFLHSVWFPYFQSNFHNKHHMWRKLARPRVHYRTNTLWVSICSMGYTQKFWDIYFNNVQAQFQWVLFVPAQRAQKVNGMTFKKDMPRLGLEPNTCSLHEHWYSTLPPGLLVNTSNFRKYRRHAVDSEPSLTLIHVFLQISKILDVWHKKLQ